MNISQGTPIFTIISVDIVILTFLIGQYNREERLEREVFQDKYREYIQQILSALAIALVSLVPFGISILIAQSPKN
ncbi:hypothetical protein [Halogeometricum sp. CBA1124]|uniref:hypothetical protein n=1 Tax=Halogeometricum sp. CBA1124 TaxID=2668071 RepID=UPI00142CE219|nr:hypothetical protein [Halogeometricum sp. CBA1124]MUV56085.1 hypothetical protein [Halogeometricum sp. CBA1124]